MELKEFCSYIKDYSKGVNLVNFSLKLKQIDKVDYNDTEIRSSWKISFIVEEKNLGSSVFKIFRDDPIGEEINVLKSYAWGVREFIKDEMSNYSIFIKFDENIANCKLVRRGE